MNSDKIQSQPESGLYTIQFSGQELFWLKIDVDGTVTAGKGDQSAKVIHDEGGWVFVKGDGIDAYINTRPAEGTPDQLQARWLSIWDHKNGQTPPQTQSNWKIGGNPHSFRWH